MKKKIKFIGFYLIFDPVGLVPKSHVSAQQVETYMGQQRIKRREMLQKLMDLCHSSQVILFHSFV